MIQNSGILFKNPRPTKDLSIDENILKSLKILPFFCQSLKLKTHLSGIDISKVSIGLFDYRPVFIIGARPSEPDQPQLWIDKDNFQIMFIQNEGYSYRFSYWQYSPSLKINFPSQIEFKKHGDDVLIIDLAVSEVMH
jgi:hypothetical protein